MAQPAERLAGVLQGGPDHLGPGLGRMPRATALKEIQFHKASSFDRDVAGHFKVIHPWTLESDSLADRGES